jgi:5-methyltetrahydropteroyltriglutamate--homocysteine methyltransferase
VRKPRTPARAEVVGSLLRPPALRAAIDAVYEPGHRALLAEERSKDLSGLREAEDTAIREAIGRQESLGLDVVTDGELRRYMFLNSFWDAVEGFSTDRVKTVFRNAEGDEAIWYVQRVEERLRRIDSPAAREAAFLASVATRPFKVTFPAASLFRHPFTFTPEHAYADLDELVAHAIEIERGLIADAITAGARYVQLDFPLYPYLVDERWAGAFRKAGHDLERLLDGAIAADNAVLEGIPAGVTKALHVCRGNYRSRWLCEGSLAPVAERMFGELAYDAFLVEWDDVGRDGGYEPIRHVPAGKTMVMGLVSTKTPVLESEEDLVRRLDEASGHLPLEQLAISPQCGFASVMEGNEIDEETQWRKLDVVARVADRVWSSDP